MGSIPFIGIGVDIAKGIMNIFTDMDSIDLNSQSSIKKAMNITSTTGAISGNIEFLLKAASITGKATKASGFLSTAGTVTSGMSLLDTLAFEHSVEVEEAVQTSGVVQGDNLETLIPFATELEFMMSGYLEEGYVDVIVDKNGVDKSLQWNNNDAKETFDYKVDTFRKNELEN